MAANSKYVEDYKKRLRLIRLEFKDPRQNLSWTRLISGPLENCKEFKKTPQPAALVASTTYMPENPSEPLRNAKVYKRKGRPLKPAKSSYKRARKAPGPIRKSPPQSRHEFKRTDRGRLPVGQPYSGGVNNPFRGEETFVSYRKNKPGISSGISQAHHKSAMSDDVSRGTTLGGPPRSISAYPPQWREDDYRGDARLRRPLGGSFTEKAMWEAERLRSQNGWGGAQADKRVFENGRIDLFARMPPVKKQPHASAGSAQFGPFDGGKSKLARSQPSNRGEHSTELEAGVVAKKGEWRPYQLAYGGREYLPRLNEHEAASRHFRKTRPVEDVYRRGADFSSPARRKFKSPPPRKFQGRAVSSFAKAKKEAKRCFGKQAD